MSTVTQSKVSNWADNDSSSSSDDEDKENSNIQEAEEENQHVQGHENKGPYSRKDDAIEHEKNYESIPVPFPNEPPFVV